MTCPCDKENCNNAYHLRVGEWDAYRCPKDDKTRLIKIGGTTVHEYKPSEIQTCACNRRGCVAKVLTRNEEQISSGEHKIECPTTQLVWIDDGTWVPRLDLYLFAVGDVGTTVGQPETVWGEATKGSEALDYSNRARLIKEAQKKMESTLSEFIGKTNDADTRNNMVDAMMAAGEDFIDKKVVKDWHCEADVESWTNMEGVSKVRGLWNRLLNKIWGESIAEQNIKWYHLLLGYELKSTSFISLEPYLETQDGEFYYSIEEDMWNRNAHANASTSAVIRTPRTVVDLTMTPAAPVKSINLSFKISNEN